MRSPLVLSACLSCLGCFAVVLAACGGDDPTPSGSSSGASSTSSSGGTSSGGSTSSSSGGTSSGGSSGGAPWSTTPKDGIATYYDADGSGNCSFDKSPGDLDVVALNPEEYAKSAACGGCLKVTGPSGDVTVRVVDSCPGCATGHLDLSKEAFAKIAELKVGRVSITYQGVACGVSGNMSYRFKDGSSKFWTAIQVLNHRVPIEKLEYEKAGAWVAMKRESYNYFVESKGVGVSSDLKVRATGVNGQVVEDTLATVGDGNTVAGAGQL